VSTRGVTAGPVPWRLANLIVLWITLAAGATLLLLAWWGASATADGPSQVAWINVGVCGLIVSGAGVTSWVLSGRRAVGARRVLLVPDAALRTDAVRADDRRPLVTARHLTRYHRAGCPMVAGKRTRAATAARHRAAGLEPCGVCRPAS
jgi:hypothetical protein